MLIIDTIFILQLVLFYRFISVSMQGRHCLDRENILKVNSFPDHVKSGDFMFVQGTLEGI